MIHLAPGFAFEITRPETITIKATRIGFKISENRQYVNLVTRYMKLLYLKILSENYTEM